MITFDYKLNPKTKEIPPERQLIVATEEHELLNVCQFCLQKTKMVNPLSKWLQMNFMSIELVVSALWLRLLHHPGDIIVSVHFGLCKHLSTGYSLSFSPDMASAPAQQPTLTVEQTRGEKNCWYVIRFTFLAFLVFLMRFHVQTQADDVSILSGFSLVMKGTLSLLYFQDQALICIYCRNIAITDALFPSQ